MLRRAVFAVVLALVASSSLLGQEAVTLQLKLPKGHVAKITTDTDQRIETNFQGFASAFQQKMSMGAKQEVKDVDAAGNMTLGITYEWVTMKSDNPQAPVDYDSRNPQGEVPLGAAGMAGLVGQGFEMVISPAGKVVELRNLEQMLDRMMENSKLPPEIMPIVREAMKAQFGPESMKANIESTSAIYPDKAVKVGDIWHGTAVIPMLGTTIETDYTLKGRQGGKATIEMKGTLGGSDEPQEINLGVASLKMQLTGTQTGTTVIDEATGMARSSNTSFDMQGEMIVNNPAAGQELKIPTSIKGTVNVTTE